MIFNVARNVYPLVSGQQAYTIGPGGNFNPPRPIWIQDAGIISTTSALQPLELPMAILSDDEWAGLSIKRAELVVVVPVLRLRVLGRRWPGQHQRVLAEPERGDATDRALLPEPDSELRDHQRHDPAAAGVPHEIRALVEQMAPEALPSLKLINIEQVNFLAIRTGGTSGQLSRRRRGGWISSRRSIHWPLRSTRKSPSFAGFSPLSKEASQEIERSANDVELHRQGVAHSNGY